MKHDLRTLKKIAVKYDNLNKKNKVGKCAAVYSRTAS